MTNKMNNEERAWIKRMNNPQLAKKRYHYQNAVENHFGGSHAVRITVPAVDKTHIDSAVLHFETLSQKLKEIQNLKHYRDLDKLHAFRLAIFQCHRDLKNDADDSLAFVLDPAHDFRGAK
tara:strand:- start:1258 stop:1617 length:360 start_codon:yes stop_codon:yes gene_type:complete